MPPVLNKLLKSTSPSSSNSHGSDIMGTMTTEQQETLSTNDDGIKKLTILHYNDVYNIDTQGFYF